MSCVNFEEGSCPVWSDDCGQVCSLWDLLRPSSLTFPVCSYQCKRKLWVRCPDATVPWEHWHRATVNVIALNFSSGNNLCQGRCYTVKSRPIPLFTSQEDRLCGIASLCVSVMTFSASLMSYVIQHWRRLLTCNREELGWCGCPRHAQKSECGFI